MRRKLPTKPMETKQKILQIPHGLAGIIAKKAGVSHTTVTNVAFGNPCVAPATILKVTKVAGAEIRKAAKKAQKQQTQIDNAILQTNPNHERK